MSINTFLLSFLIQMLDENITLKLIRQNDSYLIVYFFWAENFQTILSFSPFSRAVLESSELLALTWLPRNNNIPSNAISGMFQTIPAFQADTVGSPK